MTKDNIKTLAEIKQIMQKAKSDGKKVVLTNGCFDILHLGHVKYLENAKKLGDLLIIAVNSDRSVKLNKDPIRPIIPENERAVMLASLSSVDYVFIFDDKSMDNTLSELKPEIYVKGADYNINTVVQSERKIVEDNGGKIEFVKGTDDDSTSKLINRIVNEHIRLSQTKNILIMKLGAAGDVLRTTCILKPLKSKYPKSNISWVTSKNNSKLLKNNTDITNIYIFDDSLKDKLRDEKFDLIISLDDEHEACEFVSSLEYTELIGSYLDENKKRTYTKSSESWFGMGLLRQDELGGRKKADELKKTNDKTFQWHMFNIIGLDNEKAKINTTVLNLTGEELKFGEEFASKNGIKNEKLVIGLNTGAGKRWPLKSWLIDRSAELADRLNKELGAKVVLLGGREEKERNQQIKTLCKSEVIDSGPDNSMRDFCSLINQCDLLVTSDSLALHIAIALRKKVIVFFGPTSSTEIEVYDLGEKVIPNMDCECCYKQKCDTKPNCIDNIPVEKVFNAVKEVLKF